MWKGQSVKCQNLLPRHSSHIMGVGWGQKTDTNRMAGWLCTYSAVNFWFLDCIVYGISKNFEFIWNVRPTKMHPSHFLHLPVWQCCTTSCQPLALLLFHGTGCTYGKQKFSVAQVSRTFQAKASLAYDGVSIDTEKAIFGHSCDLLNSILVSQLHQMCQNLPLLLVSLFGYPYVFCIFCLNYLGSPYTCIKFCS